MKGSRKAKYKGDSAALRTLLRLVAQHCLDCSGGTRGEIEHCTVTDCPLWEWRFGCLPGSKSPVLAGNSHEPACKEGPSATNAPRVDGSGGGGHHA